MLIYPLGILVLCGLLIAIQATTNSALARSLGLFPFATIFSFLQLLTTLPFLYFAVWPVRWNQPAWQYLGTLLGFFILVGIASSIAKTGAFAGLVALLVGQLVMGILIDRFGLFGVPPQPITLTRLLGLLFVLLGAWFSSIRAA